MANRRGIDQGVGAAGAAMGAAAPFAGPAAPFLAAGAAAAGIYSGYRADKEQQKQEAHFGEWEKSNMAARKRYEQMITPTLKGMAAGEETPIQSAAREMEKSRLFEKVSGISDEAKRRAMAQYAREGIEAGDKTKTGAAAPTYRLMQMDKEKQKIIRDIAVAIAEKNAQAKAANQQYALGQLGQMGQYMTPGYVGGPQDTSWGEAAPMLFAGAAKYANSWLFNKAPAGPAGTAAANPYPGPQANVVPQPQPPAYARSNYVPAPQVNVSAPSNRVTSAMLPNDPARAGATGAQMSAAYGRRR